MRVKFVEFSANPIKNARSILGLTTICFSFALMVLLFGFIDAIQADYEAKKQECIDEFGERL